MTSKKKSTTSLGELIHQVKDDEGLISVYQRKEQRFLTFGNAVEQSCINLTTPYQLEHVYTQAMMISLLLSPEVGCSLLLGLGGGSLARALHQANPDMQVHAVEYRQAVIDTAQQFFELSDTPQLHLHCDDATAFIKTDTRPYGLIFADLYLAEGAHHAQKDQTFFSDCQQRLSENGILITNHWSSEFKEGEIARQGLQAIFAEKTLYLNVQGGNIVRFAFNNELPVLNRNHFFDNAQQLGNRLNIPLDRLARNFWRQNAAHLQTGRYSRNRSSR